MCTDRGRALTRAWHTVRQDSLPKAAQGERSKAFRAIRSAPLLQGLRCWLALWESALSHSQNGKDSQGLPTTDHCEVPRSHEQRKPVAQGGAQHCDLQHRVKQGCSWAGWERLLMVTGECSAWCPPPSLLNWAPPHWLAWPCHLLGACSEQCLNRGHPQPSCPLWEEMYSSPVCPF